MRSDIRQSPRRVKLVLKPKTKGHPLATRECSKPGRLTGQTNILRAAHYVVLHGTRRSNTLKPKQPNTQKNSWKAGAGGMRTLTAPPLLLLFRTDSVEHRRSRQLEDPPGYHRSRGSRNVHGSTHAVRRAKCQLSERL